MSSITPRLLVVDDEADIINAYKKILSAAAQPRSANERSSDNSRLNNLADKLFTDTPKPSPEIARFTTDYCNQGDMAVQLIKDSIKYKRPYFAVFLDVRMPPGPDGVWVAQEIRKIDQFVNIVIVTAYSDISPTDITALVQPPHRLLYVQKPFNSHEIRQLATALLAKWLNGQNLRNTNKHLEDLVSERTAELSLAIEALEKSNSKYRQTALDLQKAEKELMAKSDDLAGTNQALQQMMQKNKEDRQEIEQKIMFTVHEMVEPYIERLHKSKLNDTQQSFLNMIKTNLAEITAPFMQGLAHRYFRLNPMEIKVADLIRQGLTTIKIADELNTSKRNIDFYRDQIREKIGIKNTKANLKAVLRDLETEM